MARSRLEKIGTIFSRTTGLMKSGALSWDDRPLWYDVYEAFPPNEEPRFDRPIPNIKLKQIFYTEDKVRALFHKNNKQIGTTNMSNYEYKTVTQKFINTFQKLEERYQGKVPNEQIYLEAIDMMKRERASKREIEDDEPVSLSSAFKEAGSKQRDSKIKIDVMNIFKK